MTRASISLASGEAANGTSHQEENGEMKVSDYFLIWLINLTIVE